MEEQTPSTMQTYYPLGNRTFLMIILRRVGVYILLVPLLAVFVYCLRYIPFDYMRLAINAILVYSLILLIFCIGLVLLAWLEYFRFGISITDEDLRIKRGLFATEELGIPYRRIRDIKIQRSLLDQMFGVSNIIVILSDFEGAEPLSEESTVFLPSLAKKTALEIQNGILKKSQIEQIHVVDMHNDVISKLK